MIWCSVLCVHLRECSGGGGDYRGGVDEWRVGEEKEGVNGFRVWVG